MTVTAPIEESPPHFTPIADILEKGGRAREQLEPLRSLHILRGGPVAVLMTAAGVFLIGVSGALADRVSEMIRDWRRPGSDRSDDDA